MRGGLRPRFYNGLRPYRPFSPIVYDNYDYPIVYNSSNIIYYDGEALTKCSDNGLKPCWVVDNGQVAIYK